MMDETKAIYIIVEGESDAQILHTLLNCDGFKSVYHMVAGGYNNLSSIARTIRLMKAPMESNDKIIVAFDSDSEKKDAIEDKIATMRFLTNADYDKRIGVFCFVPTIDKYLFPQDVIKTKGISKGMVEYMKKNIDALRSKPTIKAIQKFIDE